MNKQKIIRFVFLFFAIFGLSVIYTYIDKDTSNITAFELGKVTGEVMRQFVKILFSLLVILYALRVFRQNEIGQTHKN